MSAVEVEVRSVCKTFGSTTALDKVDLVIEQGAFAVLLGPSGSGKTTLLSILGGFAEPTSGQVWIAGEDMAGRPPARRPTTTVFQDYALFPHMSVAGNVGFGLAMRGVSANERRSKIADTLDMVGLAGFEQRRIHQLSGGQRQRVALARALVVEPKVLLLDEPLGALDLNLRRQMQEELSHLQKRIGTTFVHVTHDQDEAMSMADVVVVMNQGRIEDVGPPGRVYLQPATRFAATFMGASNLIEGGVVRADRGRLTLDTPLGWLEVAGNAEVGDRLALSLRPEQIALEDLGVESLPLGEAVIVEQVFHGTHRRAHVKAGSNGEVELRLHLPQRCQVGTGERVSLFARRQDLVLLKD